MKDKLKDIMRPTIEKKFNELNLLISYNHFLNVDTFYLIDSNGNRQVEYIDSNGKHISYNTEYFMMKFFGYKGNNRYLTQSEIDTNKKIRETVNEILKELLEPWGIGGVIKFSPKQGVIS